MGSTGIGGGIAIPHARLGGLDQALRPVRAAAHPVDFDSIDERPVDIVFLLDRAQGAGADHLKALARVSRLLPIVGWSTSCAPESADTLYALRSHPSSPHGAALERRAPSNES